jgi:tripartite-type tricarboxylate transporter receptor subunit TctC
MNAIVRTTALLASLCAAGLAQAQTFPSRTFTILVTTAGGGPLDVVARIWADNLRKKSPETVIVETRAGAAGVLAMSALASAPADGHMVTLGGNQIQALLVKDLGYDPAKVAPVSIIAQTSFTLMASKQSSYNTYAQLIAFAKANPGKLAWGYIQGVHELYTRAFLQHIGIQTNLIPYKGTAPVETALMAGEIEAAIISNFVRVLNGQVVGLATSADARRPEIPTVPTFREVGIGYEPHGLITAWARSDTPAALLDRLNREAVEVARSPELVAALKKFGMEPMGTTREQAVKQSADDLEALRRVAPKLL